MNELEELRVRKAERQKRIGYSWAARADEYDEAEADLSQAIALAELEYENHIHVHRKYLHVMNLLDAAVTTAKALREHVQWISEEHEWRESRRVLTDTAWLDDR